MATISIYSCKKEDVLQAQNGYNFNLSVHEIPDEGKALSLNSKTCLSFASIADYTTAITNPTDTQQTTLTNLIKSFTSFTSYTTVYPNSILFKGETFTDLLNPDGVIMIGGNYFKVDPTVEKVFVLPQADVAFYSDLISSNPSSGKVVMFSFYEEVLDLIAAGALNNTQVVSVQVPEVITATSQKSLRSLIVKTVKAVTGVINEVVATVTNVVNKVATAVVVTIHTIPNASCTDPTVGHQHDGKDLKNQVGISADAYYNTLGIYFHLFSQVGPVNGYPNQYRFGFVGGIGSTVKPIKRDSGYVEFFVKCANSQAYEKNTPGSLRISLNPEPGGAIDFYKYVYSAYSGTHRLTKVYFKFSILYYGVSDSELIGFRQNL